MTTSRGSGNNYKSRAVLVPLIVLMLATALLSPLRSTDTAFATSAGGLDANFRGVGWNSYGEDGMWFDTDDVVVQSDGKIVVGGSRLNGMRYDPMMLRFHSNGLLDTSFGVDGVVVAEWPNSEGIVGKVNEEGAGVGLDVLSDDRLALVSSPLGNDGSEKHGVMLFTADGTLDTSFSGDGRVTVENWGETMDIYTLDVLVDENTDRILVMGVAPNNSWDFKVNLLRFNTDGTLDPTFGWHGNGKSGYLWPNAVDNIGHTLAMSDHKIFVGGSSSTDYTHHLMSIMQLGKDGASYDWATTVDFGFGDSKAKAMTVQNSDEVVAAGWTYVSGNYTIPAVTRINSVGSIDTSFGEGDGKFTYDFGASVDSTANSVIIDSENRIVIGGQYDIYGSSRPFIMRLTSDGELDTTFGDSGVMLYDEMIAGNAEWFMSVARYDYHDVIAAGGTGTNVLVTRLNDLYSNTLNITYDSQDGSDVTDGDSTTTAGGSITTLPTDPTRTGYTFTGWYTATSGGTQITAGAAHNQTTDFTLYAQWTADTLDVTYDSQGGSTVTDGDATTTAGGSITTLPTDPTRDGYTFNGWYTATSGGTQITAGTAHNQTADFTLYAQWQAVPTTTTTTTPPTTTTTSTTTTTVAPTTTTTAPPTSTPATTTTAPATTTTVASSDAPTSTSTTVATTSTTTTEVQTSTTSSTAVTTTSTPETSEPPTESVELPATGTSPSKLPSLPLIAIGCALLLVSRLPNRNLSDDYN